MKSISIRPQSFQNNYIIITTPSFSCAFLFFSAVCVFFCFLPKIFIPTTNSHIRKVTFRCWTVGRGGGWRDTWLWCIKHVGLQQTAGHVSNSALTCYDFCLSSSSLTCILEMSLSHLLLVTAALLYVYTLVATKSAFFFTFIYSWVEPVILTWVCYEYSRELWQKHK